LRSHGSRRRAAAFRLHTLPVKVMVPRLRRVVEQTLVSCLMRLLHNSDAVIRFHLSALNHLVGYGHVLGVVLVMVYL
jgi:hypothetical protein